MRPMFDLKSVKSFGRSAFEIRRPKVEGEPWLLLIEGSIPLEGKDFDDCLSKAIQLGLTKP